VSASSLRRRLLEEAEKDARAVRPHPGKTAPDPAGTAGVPPPAVAGATPSVGSALRSAGLVPAADLGRRLGVLGVELEPEGLARLLRELDEALDGRLLRELDAAARDALTARVRASLVAAAPGVRRAQAELAREVAALRGAYVGTGLRVSTVELRDGIWVYFHTDVARDAVVVGEAFVARRAGAAVPTRRPDPARAGLEGRPRWRVGDSVRDVAPPPAPTAPRASGLREDALDAGAQAVLARVGEAQEAALGQAARASSRRVRTAGPLSAVERLTEGGGIESISLRAPTDAGPRAGYHREYTIAGRTQPERPRRPDGEMDAVLPPAGKLGDPRYRGWARAHAWGPGLGDETFAGLAYAPHEAANLLQAATTEGFLRWGANTSGLNVRAGTHVEIRVKVADRAVGGRRYPFLRSAEYSIELEDGTKAVATLTVDASGAVATSFRLL
jgi:hypothetical protein